MKKLLPIYTIIVLALAACCKAECLPNGVTVTFEKFKARDADSVLIVRYRPGTNFSALLDSAWTITPVSTSDTTHSGLVKFLPGNDEAKIYLSSLNKTYLLRDIESERINCGCGNGKIDVVRSLILNGVQQQGDFIVLN